MRLAIFDFDGTILRGNSWHEFFRAELWRRPDRAPSLLIAYLLRRMRRWSGMRLREFTLHGLHGRTSNEVAAVGQRLYDRRLRSRLRAEALAEIERRREEGFTVVLATGAFDFVIAPFARAVGVEYVAATRVPFAHGHCLGCIAGPENFGGEKVARLHEMFATATVDWKGSCCFSDDLSDAPMLALVGDPVFVTSAMRPHSLLPPTTRQVVWK